MGGRRQIHLPEVLQAEQQAGLAAERTAAEHIAAAPADKTAAGTPAADMVAAGTPAVAELRMAADSRPADLPVFCREAEECQL